MSFIHLILSFKLYNNILKRQKYYTEDPYRLLKQPKEPLCEKIRRLLFTNELPPLYFDYILSKPTEQSIDNLVLAMKQNNGYGFRRQTLQSSKLMNSVRSKTRTLNKTSSILPDNKSQHNSSVSPSRHFLSSTKITPIL